MIITGIGELTRGELAGERMYVAYSERSQEDEHSCFSDNTTADLVGNAPGHRDGAHRPDYPGSARARACSTLFDRPRTPTPPTARAEIARRVAGRRSRRSRHRSTSTSPTACPTTNRVGPACSRRSMRSRRRRPTIVAAAETLGVTSRSSDVSVRRASLLVVLVSSPARSRPAPATTSPPVLDPNLGGDTTRDSASSASFASRPRT